MDSENIFNIELINNNGKKWLSEENCHIKGFAFYNEELLEGSSLINIIKESIESDTFDSVLTALNGNFTAVITINDKAYLISDKIRSYPLIFSRQNDGKWFITDSAIGIESNEAVIKKIDSINSLEFLALGYVSGNETLYEDIFTVDAGEYVVLGNNGANHRTSYFKYIFDKETFDQETIIKRAYDSLERAFQRTIATIPAGSQIVIPLSGGYDSRLIACLCKKYGLKNVVCYTYGRSDSFEVSISRKVADQLGIEWHYVEYKSGEFSSIIDKDEFKRYSLFSQNYNTIPHVQDYIAVKTLKGRGILKSGAIVIPGFCGDLFGGSKIPKEVFYWATSKFNKISFTKLIFKHFYDLNTPLRHWQKKIRRKIMSQTIQTDVSAEDMFLNNYEHWCIQNRLSKFIINSLRVYEFFEMDWRMPLWDDEYAVFWYTIPWRQKSPELLNKFMFDRYFDNYEVKFLKPVSNKTLQNIKMIIPPKLRPLIKSVINVIYEPFVDKTKKDINSFSGEAICTYQKMIKKHEKHVSIKKDSIGAILAAYIINDIENENI